MPKTTINNIFKFLICLTICLGGGWLTGLLTEHGVKAWYPHLIKSSLTPPDIVFPIAWTILYILMAFSLFLVWTSNAADKKNAYIIFGLQLFFNFVWSWLFFYLQTPAIALVDIVLLWGSIVATIIVFWRYSHNASLLLIPYLGWVSFAFYLNYFIWMHN